MSSLGFVLLVIVILILLGSIGGPYIGGAGWSPGYGFGYPVTGGIGIVLLILIILVVIGRI